MSLDFPTGEAGTGAAVARALARVVARAFLPVLHGLSWCLPPAAADQQAAPLSQQAGVHLARPRPRYASARRKQLRYFGRASSSSSPPHPAALSPIWGNVWNVWWEPAWEKVYLLINAATGAVVPMTETLRSFHESFGTV